ncbi:MAG TPA: hypothetical protein PKA77_17615 [Chitinophagaceae bacterium]|jgi:hypothetical protein|nr:hypothetical protein [Chitinophagaceae bacterium]HMU59969.1 hypothetical protein [Chitinophagaceae bacterium]
MKFILTLLSFVFFINICFSQKQAISLGIGRSIHGTGDMRGWSFSVKYSKKIKKNWYYLAEVGNTIHDGIDYIFYEYPVGYPVDGSIRYTTAGFQSSFSVGYHIIDTKQFLLSFSIGTLARYQSSSYYDNVVILYEPITNLPYPVILFRNRTPQKTFAVGLSPNVAFQFPISSKHFLELNGSFQFDTNGDNISQLMLSFGKRF